MNKKLLKKIFSISLASTLMFSLSACAKKGNASANASRLDTIKKSGKLVIGTSADYPPFEFHKTINGKDEIIGFDVDIAKEIAKDMNVELQIKDMKFDGLLAALDSGNVDIVMAGMTPTEKRKKSVDFSKVYYTSLQGIIVRTEDKDKFKNLDDLMGKKIGVQKSSIQEDLAKAQIKNADLKGLGKVTDLVLELKNKKVDAIVVEKPVAEAYVSKNPDMSIAQATLKPSEDNGSAIAIKKGSGELVDQINKTLDRLINEKAIDKFVTKANEQIE